jgi:hypothetical protein
VEKYCRAEEVADDMRIACWIPRATHTHSEYVILMAFPQQKFFSDSATMLRNVQCLSRMNERQPGLLLRAPS